MAGLPALVARILDAPETLPEAALAFLAALLASDKHLPALAPALPAIRAYALDYLAHPLAHTVYQRACALL